ncbi:hypothetical protein GAYE_PCTG30G0656 [Galdieria yellowstonensis]|uniref:Uncharacterized protein n=1 Tax=Galdieria yellowstonensis TaxID=3028027 RepID=A0AAV9I2Z0_9RHOD|nr:hypothetical protein GAYE_PCTG30G0656 [Galdieria yellowstonensis]
MMMMRRGEGAILRITSDQYLLVGFDEEGVFHLRQRSFDPDDSDGRFRPYNDLFGIVRELFSCLIFSHSRWKERRPGRTELHQASIEEQLKKSTFKNAPASSFLYHQGFAMMDLSELLLEYTGGVPGLLVRAFGIVLE